jgi:hypothetical protein
VQEVEPGVDEYVPNGHAVQAIAFAPEYVPTGHCLHVLLYKKEPAGQEIQSDKLVELRSEVPVGQVVLVFPSAQ